MLPAGIVDLIRSISEEFGTSMLYISHNLGLVRETCSRITVMYSGQGCRGRPATGCVQWNAPPVHPGIAGGDSNDGG